MPDITYKEVGALHELISTLSPSLSLSLAEQLNQMVDLDSPAIDSVPLQDLLSRTESVLSTVFSLSAPTTTEMLMVFSRETALLLSNLIAGISGESLPTSLTETQTEDLGKAMQAVTRGLATALTNQTGDLTEVESCTTHLGPLVLPPVFAMESSVIQVVMNLNLPQLPEATLTFLLTPDLVFALVAAGDEATGTPDAIAGGSSLSEDELAAMLNDLGGMPGPMSSTPPMGGLAGSPFPSFSAPQESMMPRGMELILDIPLDVTVELGRVRMLIKDVLELSSGSIVELDRVAGEPVDLLVNGRLIAKGEVVVIEDNFGIRITEIISPADRVAGLGRGR
jgi:flagellar motor switch protein FliN/FliY